MEEKYEWDENKRRANLEKHGIDFSAVYDFDWATAIFMPDDRSGERRTKAYCPIEKRLHLLVYTVRGDSTRIISLRRANSREVNQYERKQGLRKDL